MVSRIFGTRQNAICARYNGIPRAHFPLFLKECEWRFNYRPSSQLLETLTDWMGLQHAG